MFKTSPYGKDVGEKVPGEKKKIGTRAARAWADKQKGGAARPQAPPMRPAANQPRPFDPKGAEAPASRWIAIPAFLAIWFRRRKTQG